MLADNNQSSKPALNTSNISDNNNVQESAHQLNFSYLDEDYDAEQFQPQQASWTIRKEKEKEEFPKAKNTTRRFLHSDTEDGNSETPTFRNLNL